jgi:hypothetical protein
MSELSISATGVVAANTETVTAYGTAGTAISAGQAVWLDSTVSPNLLFPAQATVQTQAQNLVGIALDSAAGSAQPIAYASAGEVILPLNGGSVLPTGTTYVLSTAVAGGIVPSTEPAAGTASFISVLGLAISPSHFRVSINALGAVR